MSSTNLNLTSKNIINWFNAMRNVPEKERTRALEAFWAGQVDSKAWLVNTLNSIVKNPSNVYIFGGWIGVLGNLILECSTWEVKKIRSIDLDPWCESIADNLNQPYLENDWTFKARTANMKDYKYEWAIDPDIIINTSTEHVSQEIYDIWWNNIPDNSLVILQGNDFFSCGEHVRCANDLEEFKKINHITSTVYEGSLPHDLYTRFMTISYK